MIKRIEKWIRIERTILEELLQDIKSGTKIISATGEDRTESVKEKLTSGLEVANDLLSEIERSTP